MARKSEDKVTVGNYTLPGGLGGEMVRFACDYLKARPEGVWAAELVTKSAHAAGLNVSTANWLTSPNQKNSPTGHLFGRRQATNRKTGRKAYVYFLLPDGEKLVGTFEPVRKARLEAEKAAFRKRYGVDPGDSVRFIKDAWQVGVPAVPEGAMGVVVSVDEDARCGQVLSSTQVLVRVSFQYQVRRVKAPR